MSISLDWGPDGEPGGGLLFQRGLQETGREGFWELSICFCGALRREPGGGAQFLGILNTCKEGSGDGTSFSM
jgi:hypothetical protein